MYLKGRLKEMQNWKVLKYGAVYSHKAPIKMKE